MDRRSLEDPSDGHLPPNRTTTAHNPGPLRHAKRSSGPKTALELEDFLHRVFRELRKKFV
jgi:hypothetical protein